MVNREKHVAGEEDFLVAEYTSVSPACVGMAGVDQFDLLAAYVDGHSIAVGKGGITPGESPPYLLA